MATSKSATAGRKKKQKRTRDVERDSFDFRDLIYRPALAELQPSLMPQWPCITILDQEKQGACTGFGLAAMINYQNARAGDKTRVSARMLFEMAKRYDQWPGSKYDWSSSRGAMKGWHRHGVCPESDWPNDAVREVLTWERQKAALRYVLGAYYRIMPRRNDVHSALSEVGVVYAAADTHDGWDEPDDKGRIVFEGGEMGGGGHAFAVVGHAPEGFLIQNSWGEDWGGWVDDKGTRHAGIALWKYADFDLNVWDLWVARKALPVESMAALRGGRYTLGTAGTRVTEDAPPALEIWNNYVHIDDGQFDPRGDYPSSASETKSIVKRLVQGVGQHAIPPKHIVLYAHGGLNSLGGAAKRVSKWKEVFEDNGIACLHFIWETGFFEELRDLLLGKENFAKQRVAGVSSWWDRIVEGAAQPLGVPLWREMRSDAEIAFAKVGAGSITLAALAQELVAAGANAPKLHLVAHSAGSMFFGNLLAQVEPTPAIENLVLFAPACTVEFFNENIAPALARKRVARLHHFYLDDKREQDDNVAQVYRKSLLYLVSNALQDRNRKVPLLGMETFWTPLLATLDPALKACITSRNPRDNGLETASKSHGGFDNDLATMNSMLRIVLGGKPERLFEAEDLAGY